MADFNVNDARRMVAENRELLEITIGLARRTCDVRIQDAARRGRTHASYDVPASIFGRPTYDRHELAAALAEALRADGFSAGVDAGSTHITISWGSAGGGAGGAAAAAATAAAEPTDRPPAFPPDVAEALSAIDLARRSRTQAWLQHRRK
jgi:hypothetical protein